MTVSMTAPRRPREPGGWTLAALLADLEQQAGGLAQASRDEEVAELEQAHYAEIDLLARLHGAAPRTPELDVRLLGGAQLRGRLVRVGADFLVLGAESSAAQWVVPTAALARVGGLGGGTVERALLPDARPLPARVGLRSVLRELGEQEVDVSLLLRDGSRLSARVLRVGTDFVELGGADGSASLVPTGSLAALCPR